VIGPEIEEMKEGEAYPLGIRVYVAGREFQEDFESVLERRIHEFISCANGIFHMGQRAIIWVRISKDAQQKGFKVCGWNGLGFDLKWIGHQAEDMALAARIALKSYDPMFQFFNQSGFPVGLEKVAEGMGIPQEKLMEGADAPKQWRAGNHQEVMDYCLGDCQMTNLIVRAIQEERQVRWVTGKGYVSSKPMPRLKSVEEVIQDPEPDQSWMNNPLLKIKFYEWVQAATETKT